MLNRPFLTGLELVQCFERAVLAHPKVEDPRIHSSATAGEVRGRDHVSEAHDYLLQLSDAGDVSEIVGEYGARPLYRMLGYFSLVGLLRVHVLLGDFTLALKVLDNIELNQKVRLSSTCDSI